MPGLLDLLVSRPLSCFRWVVVKPFPHPVEMILTHDEFLSIQLGIPPCWIPAGLGIRENPVVPEICFRTCRDGRVNRPNHLVAAKPQPTFPARPAVVLGTLLVWGSALTNLHIGVTIAHRNGKVRDRSPRRGWMRWKCWKVQIETLHPKNQNGRQNRRMANLHT